MLSSRATNLFFKRDLLDKRENVENRRIYFVTFFIYDKIKVNFLWIYCQYLDACLVGISFANVQVIIADR